MATEVQSQIISILPRLRDEEMVASTEKKEKGGK